ncbi:MAG: type II secretion system GspH family protein [Verrucomicrobiae bacterium]|nr:type II secretion system GspH family protein [Verrucomicrobiae bacterium]NNJ85693.1 type II secretion system protein [Akkermansiaceae bacterium]
MRGFTLVELLVVIAIVSVLAALVFSISGKMMLKAQKVTCTAAMKDVSLALSSYEVDYNKLPLPQHKDEWDTILGDPDGLYSTAPLVSVLTGADDSEWSENDGNSFDLSTLNPNNEVYLSPNIARGKREAGIKEDGKLYDPWGRELMFALNSRRQNHDENEGYRDKILHTWGLAEWAETKPGYENFVIWSYGKDGIKGRGEEATFAGSDDVKSF